MTRNYLGNWTLIALCPAFVVSTAVRAEGRKTSLLPDDQLAAIVAEASGSLAKETVTKLATYHRVQASAGFHEAASFIAEKARAYGLEDVRIESFPADGTTTYGTFRSYLGWEAESGVLTEVAPRSEIVADFSKMRVALADYSNAADVTATLVDVGSGTTEADYAGRDVRGRIVLAGGGVASVHKEAVEKRGAAGILSYQPNQTTGWSGDYEESVRWGHLSPYNTKNAFAFMCSLHRARDYRARLARGEEIRLHALVKARVVPGSFEVVTAILQGTDPSAGEIVFTCHLCHQLPGANDNASGAATILEVARVLAKLVREGTLPRPRRTIRFLWPPEIAGTMCYLARHPELARTARAAIHMDMVGGSHAVTKAILHLTRTPASLPSCVNDVAAVFGEWVVDGSRRAAMAGDLSDAMLAPDGTKEMLVADISRFTMGSDHDVLQEGSFRIPTIYMNDWPDVFIHTNDDMPANLDATKLRRVAVIGAAAGEFLAAAGEKEARRLAFEVFTRGAARQSDALRRALARGDWGDATAFRFEEAQGIVGEAARQEREALASVASFAPSDVSLSRLLESLKERVAARAREDRALVARQVAIPAGTLPADPAARVVPRRNPGLVGPVKVYYGDTLLDRLDASPAGDELVQYETLNLVDGRRSALEIRHILRASYAPVTSREVLDYLKLLEKAGVVTLETR